MINTQFEYCPENVEEMINERFNPFDQDDIWDFIRVWHLYGLGVCITWWIRDLEKKQGPLKGVG